MHRKCPHLALLAVLAMWARHEPRNGDAFGVGVLGRKRLLQFVQTADLLQFFHETLHGLLRPNSVGLIFAFLQI